MDKFDKYEDFVKADLLGFFDDEEHETVFDSGEFDSEDIDEDADINYDDDDEEEDSFNFDLTEN